MVIQYHASRGVPYHTLINYYDHCISMRSADVSWKTNLVKGLHQQAQQLEPSEHFFFFCFLETPFSTNIKIKKITSVNVNHTTFLYKKNLVLPKKWMMINYYFYLRLSWIFFIKYICFYFSKQFELFFYFLKINIF